MKEYQREYEHYYQNKVDKAKKIITNTPISIIDENPTKNLADFEIFFSKFQQEYDRALFDWMIKFYWLKERIMIGEPYVNTPRRRARVFGLICKKSLNAHPSLVYGRNPITIAMKKLLDIKFPDLQKIDPFKEKVEFPYQYMNFSCVFLVHRLPFADDLLNIGEERRMTYTEFFDYCLNHIKCLNSENAEDYNSPYYDVYNGSNAAYSVSYFRAYARTSPPETGDVPWSKGR